MSESASASGGSTAGASNGSASVTPSTSSSGNTDASKAQSQTGAQTNQTKETSHAKSAETNPKTNGAAKESTESDEAEEIAVGSIKGKVPKALAQAIKNLERGFHSKAQEAAQKEKLLKLAQENPREYFKQTGKDADSLAEEWLAEKYELMQMSPEQKQAKADKAELERLRGIDKQSKQGLISRLKDLGDQIPENIEQYPKEQIEAYVQRREAAAKTTVSELDHEIGQAFSESGMPVDKYTLAKVAFEMSSAFKQGKNLSAKEALARVTTGYYEGTREHFSKMDGQRIHELLGDAVLDKIRKYDLDRVTSQAASKFGQNQHQGQGTNPSSQTQEKKQLNQVEWRKAMGLE